jgi:hypothetical protein
MTVFKPSSGSAQPQLGPNSDMHPFEAHLLTLQRNLQAQGASSVQNPAYTSAMASELAGLRQDISALQEDHGGCVSAIPGELCEHCLSVIKMRLHMLLERDRRGLRVFSP